MRAAEREPQISARLRCRRTAQYVGAPVSVRRQVFGRGKVKPLPPMRKPAAPQLPDRGMVAVCRPERDAVLKDVQAGGERERYRIAFGEQIGGLDRPRVAAM